MEETLQPLLATQFAGISLACTRRDFTPQFSRFRYAAARKLLDRKPENSKLKLGIVHGAGQMTSY